MSRISALIIVLLTLCSIASADRIWLKSGISINADKVTTKGDVVEYVVGATTYRINKSEVSRIESGSSFGISVEAVNPTVPQSSGPSSVPVNSAPAPDRQRNRVSVQELGRKLRAPQPSTKNEAALLDRILNLNRVDERALGAIESEGNPRQSAAAYAVAMQYEFKQNNLEKSRTYAQRALDFAPDNVSLLCWYSFIALQTGQNADAISSAERAVKTAPQSADAMRMLGFAYYQANRVADAIRMWKAALQVAPDEFTQAYLEKAQRENAVEDSFNEQQTAHFTLRYQGRQAGFGIGSDVMNTLERQYGELARELGAEPSSGLTVILYTEKEFFDVTQAPSWAGGANDGKLRIPVKNVSRMSPDLERVLKHELSHSFVHFITRGRCPLWIDEGLAQMMEPRSTATYGRQLAEMFRNGKQAPLRALEGSFTGLNSEQAMVAYIESLAAMEYIRSAYGMRGVQAMLSSTREEERGEDVVRAVTQRSYSQLESDIAKYLVKTYEGE